MKHIELILYVGNKEIFKAEGSIMEKRMGGTPEYLREIHWYSIKKRIRGANNLKEACEKLMRLANDNHKTKIYRIEVKVKK